MEISFEDMKRTCFFSRGAKTCLHEGNVTKKGNYCGYCEKEYCPALSEEGRKILKRDFYEWGYKGEIKNEL